MKKLLVVLALIVMTSMLSVSVFADTTVVDPQQAVDTNITADTNTDTAVAASETKDDIVKKEDVKAFKGKFSALLADLNVLRTECKANWDQIKTLNQSIKTQWTAVKTVLKGKKKDEAKKIAEEIKAKLEPDRTQVKAIHTDIKTLRDQKKAEWVNFRAAVKARDEGKATTAINNIISLKKQIIDKQKVLLPLKNDILTILKGYTA